MEKKYKEFRIQHLRATDKIKCVNECDMNLIGDNYKINYCL